MEPLTTAQLEKLHALKRNDLPAALAFLDEVGVDNIPEDAMGTIFMLQDDKDALGVALEKRANAAR